MKLDRNITNPRRGKYALIKLREVSLPFMEHNPAHQQTFAMVPIEAIDYGKDQNDFFVIRLKDKYAHAALSAYAKAAAADDREYANEVARLATIARNHPHKQKPT